MNSFDSDAMPADPQVEFTCNICGLRNHCSAAEIGREVSSCSGCRSSVRTRAIIQMLSRELFGFDMPLPEFPRIKAIRGMGTSDSSDYTGRLADLFDYRNTFYHKEPAFDITNPPEGDIGAYDFFITSEVLEHVGPPVEVAFQNIFRLLKPHGVLLMTVPYTLEETTTEHFPKLHDYGLARLRDRTVLVNRTEGGELQLFENLVFHGGGGSTLEMRRFSESDLRRILTGAGFSSIEIYGESYEPFGILHTETWSLPIAARRQPFNVGVRGMAEFVQQWSWCQAHARKLAQEIDLLKAQVADYVRYSEWAAKTIEQGEIDVKDRTEWALRLDGELNERTQWALSLDKELNEHVEIAQRLQAESNERLLWAMSLQAENKTLRERLEALQSSKWVKALKRLGIVR